MADLGTELLAGADEAALGWDESLDALSGDFQERERARIFRGRERSRVATGAGRDERQELLWPLVAGHGPEAGSRAAGHDHGVSHGGE